jgi:spermidine/putrescine transport system permease protein
MEVKQKSLTDRGLLIATLPLALILVAFFLVPLGMTALLSFQSTQYYRVVWTWDLATWRDVFSHWHYWSIMGRTLTMAAICVVLCIVISLPVAYALVHRLASLENHVKILIVFAFLTDAVLKTFGWVLFLDRSGVLNGALETLGMGAQASDVLFSPNATMIGMVYNLLPYTIFTIYLSLARIDRDLMLAAYDAGASRLRTFWEVTLPLARPGIIAGGVLVFVLSLGVFLEPKVMGGGTSPMAAELIRQTFETRVNWPLGAALTLVVIVIGTATLAITAGIVMRAQKRAGGMGQ